MGVWLRRTLVLLAAITANVVELIVLDAVRSWIRHRSAHAPAVGSVAMALFVLGASAVGTVALQTVAREEAAQATLLHVYLRDGDTADQLADLEGTLLRRPDVVSVVYVSKADALREALARPGMADLIDQTEGNPLPAAYDVRLKSLAAVESLARELSSDPRLAPDQPTSYDAATYSTLQRLMQIVAITTLVVISGLALIAAGVTGGAVRAAAVARADEVQTMRLVGATDWMVRGPFVLEGAVTGVVGGALGAVVLIAACRFLQEEAGVGLGDVLPGLGVVVLALLAAALLPVGACMGSLSAAVALRGKHW